jgi:hypothetical protein
LSAAKIKNYTWITGLYGADIEIICISEIYQLSLNVYFVSGGQITQPPTVILGEVVTNGNVSPLFSSELAGGHYDAALPVEEKELWYFVYDYVYM